MCGECKLPLDSSISTRVTFFILCRNTKYELHMYTRPIHTACVLKRKKDPNGSFIEFKTEDISVADNILVSVQKYCRKLLRVPMYHCAVCQEECPWNSRCGACQRTMYCGYDCQAADWPIHKESCKPINWDPTVPIVLAIPRNLKSCTSTHWIHVTYVVEVRIATMILPLQFVVS